MWMDWVLASLIFFFFVYHNGLVCTSESVNSNSHPGSSVGTEKAMAKANVSFWVQKEGNQPDLLCGRSADYMPTKGHFPILVCSTVVLGGRWSFLYLISPMPSEPFLLQNVITTITKEGDQ